MEALYETRQPAPLLIGGIPDDRTQSVRYGIEIPYALSLLAHGDPNAQVVGLDRIPPDQRPPTLITHFAFQIMVACGTAMALIGLAFLWLRWKRPAAIHTRSFLRLVALTTPLGFIAVEAGWVVTEVGRQPWIIYGIMRTEDAVTPMPGLVWSLVGTLVVYTLLALVVTLIMQRLIRATEGRADGGRRQAGSPHAGAAHG